jgi:hypothetical protein
MSVSAAQSAVCPTIPSMANARQSPTLRRRRLSAVLRRLRAEDGRAAKEVAEVLEWPPSKLTHMERNEWKLPRVQDIRVLLDVYGVTDERQRDELVRLARDARQRGWWHPYRDMISERYSTYIGLEAEASALLTYQPMIVPGLLQTDDYARALMRSGSARIDADEIERRVEVRVERQQILTGQDPVSLWAVIDEAALRRPVGGPETMSAQLAYLHKAAQTSHVTLQMIPFASGAHAGVGKGSFTILQFPSEMDRDAVYLDNFAGELFIEDAEDVDRFHVAFRHLVGAALSPVDTLKLLAAEMARVT